MADRCLDFTLGLLRRDTVERRRQPIMVGTLGIVAATMADTTVAITAGIMVDIIADTRTTHAGATITLGLSHFRMGI